MNGRAACQSQTDEAAASPAALGVLEEKAEREWKAMEKNGEGKNNFWADGVDAWTGLGLYWARVGKQYYPAGLNHN
jgi:hypothetical protein